MSDSWDDEAQRLLAESMSGEATTAYQKELQQHMQRPLPILGVLGPYNAGKTSLIRRLLIDEEQSVPEWLKISARPQTFECNEVEVLGCILRDTPGFESHNSQHTQNARQALTDLDGFVLVLTPQLVTANREEIVGILSGTFFGCTMNALSAKSLLIIISRLEEGKVDPVDDPAGFQEFRQLKLAELVQMLGAQGLNPAQMQILVASPDPYGLIGDRIAVSRTAYDEHRSWDGIAEVRAAVISFAAQKAELRPAAQQRYLGYTLRLEHVRLQTELSRQRLTSAGIKQLAEHANSNLMKLDAFDKQARARLTADIENDVRHTSRLEAADVGRLAANLRDRMEIIIGSWWERAVAELEKLLKDINEELTLAIKRPAIKTLLLDIQRALSQVSDPNPAPNNQKWFAAGRKAATLLSEAVHQFTELNLGLSIKNIGSELGKMHGAGGFDQYAELYGRSAILKSAAQAQRADHFMTIASATDALAPAIIELGALADQISTDVRVAQARAEKRQRINDKLQEIAQQMIESCWQVWLAQTGEPRAKLTKVAEALLADAQKQDEDIGRTELKIQRLSTHLTRKLEGFTAGLQG